MRSTCANFTRTATRRPGADSSSSPYRIPCVGAGGCLQPFFLFTMLHKYCERTRLLTTMQCLTILYSSCWRRRLLQAKQVFTIADIVETLCGRRGMLASVQFLTIVHTPCGCGRLLQAKQFFHHSGYCCGRQAHSSFDLRGKANWRG